MKNLCYMFLLLLTLPLGLTADTTKAELSSEWYHERYPFMTLRGSVFTFESEFDWPVGFHRPDSTSLTRYQFWVSHLPLWHRDKDVTAYTRGKVYDAEEVSRVVHFPWRVIRLTDYAIPVQLMAEYRLWRGTESEWDHNPVRGDTLRYQDFLKSKVAYEVKHTVRLLETEERDASEDEFNAFVDLCAQNTDYSSLAMNSDSVDLEQLAPGDLFIAHDKTGRKGQAWVVLCMLVDDDGDKLYTVGTGCSKTCAFHIPLFNDNRRFPWITADRIKELGADFSFSGFCRPRVD
jgi:hypothetical protein